MKKKRQEVEFPGTDILPIVNDALMASAGIGHGKMTPLLIVDATKRPDIRELVRIHEYLPTGDVECAWGGLPGRKDEVLLHLRFLRPVEARAVILFDIVKQGGVVDAIIQSRGFYLQPGQPGDRLMNTMEYPRILLVVGDLDFDQIWENLWSDCLTRQFRAEGKGAASSELAAKLMTEWRKLDRMNLGAGNP